MNFFGINFIKNLIANSDGDTDGSIAVNDPKILEKYINNEEFPFLVSFPRTGSHWLRMLMELYFDRPSLVRVFYYPERKDYLTLHTHDMDLDVYRKNIIYLYRNPIPTIYSQMMYEEDDLNDVDKIKHWADLYGRHLRKWLIEEDVSIKKTVVRYENLQKDLPNEFSKIAAHFGTTLDLGKIRSAMERVSKVEVKKKTTHDDQVVNLNSTYEANRADFISKHGDLIKTIVIERSLNLREYFKT